MRSVRAAVVDTIRQHARAVENASGDYDDLLDLVGDNRFVLLGESTHGTREFYRERARITRRLILEKGFTVVAIEADWPDAYDVNEFIHSRGGDSTAAALQTFERFPTWMWANAEVRDLIEWMRDHNGAEGGSRPVGIYGIDLYSVAESIDDVIAFLRAEDPVAAAEAEARYKCFAPYRRVGMEEYGRRVTTGTARSCAAPAAAQVQELALRARSHGDRHRPGDDRLISAWQNARVVANAEAYYRAMYAGGDSWNVRDRHMADTIDALSSHLNVDAASPSKLIVWAHNSHLGDARVTERAAAGELNVGQLMRQRHDGESILVGFTTYEGTVLAAERWGGAGRAQPLRPALPESFTALLHQTGMAAFSLRLRDNPQLAEALARPRPERFVGVIYAPATERQSHYFRTEMARQYDAVVHIDRTTAVEPLDSAGGS